MIEYKKWNAYREKITTAIGKWTGGVDVTSHGHSIMNDLLGKKSYMKVLILNATGKLVEDQIADWFEGNFIGMSYPDARIWCNQIGALGGITGSSVVAATVAGTLASDSRGYGGSQTALRGMEFIQASLQKHQNGASVEQIIATEKHKQGKPVIVGYARPVARTDERIGPHEKMTKRLGFIDGPHMLLAKDIAKYLESEFNLGMNIGGYTSAFLSDQGFTPIEVYRIKALCVASGVTACYVDHFDNQLAFLSLQCNDINYEGAPPLVQLTNHTKSKYITHPALQNHHH